MIIPKDGKEEREWLEREGAGRDVSVATVRGRIAQDRKLTLSTAGGTRLSRRASSANTCNNHFECYRYTVSDMPGSDPRKREGDLDREPDLPGSDVSVEGKTMTI